ncbi:competence protein CoiA family protein [Nocardia sp. NPDC056000]|uniref:competence protein CoiA family protein n=1 Tax=Nocardia sp. NPDC056000 TaxID=3345674 RepID=UPI0035E0C53A
MDESSTAEQCFALEMTAALGRYDEFIDIAVEENFATWHKTAGLVCLVCRHPVVVYRSQAHNPFVRHSSGHGVDVSAKVRKAAGETFQHLRFKYWVRDELRARGVAAEIEVWQDGRRPDVFGTRDGRGYAVEIQWSPLTVEEARARTVHHRGAGADEVVWLTRSCTWVEQLPALGIKSFTPAAGGHYFAHTGYLRHGRRAELRVEPVAVRQFFDAWLAGELAWGYRETEKAGWATVTDWTAYTAEQAENIEQMRRRVEVADKRNAMQGNAIRKQNERIDALTAQSSRYKRDLDTRTAERDTVRTELGTANDGLAQASQTITGLDTTLERMRKSVESAQAEAARSAEQYRSAAADLAARTRLARILVVIAFAFAIAAIAGWLF